MIDILAISHACVIAINRAIYRELLTLGWSVELVVPQKLKIGNSYQEAEERILGDPPLTFLPITTNHPKFYTYIGLNELINRLQPRIILLDNGPASLLALQLGYWAKRCHSKIICLAYDNLLPNVRQEVLKMHFKSALTTFLTYLLSSLTKGNIHHIFVISSDSKNVMKALGYTNRVSQIPLGYDPKIFFQNERLRNKTRNQLGLKETTIAYFGRLNPEKGVHILINALAEIKDLSWQLLLDRFNTYTNPYSNELQNIIEKRDLTSRVVYFDARHDEMPAYMNAADIVVLPSISTPTWKEQYGRVAPEAMACGRLVITSDCGALPELVGETGLIFPEKDIIALIKILRNVLVNTELRQKLCNLGEQRAKTLLSIAKQRDLMHEVFSKTVNL